MGLDLFHMFLVSLLLNVIYQTSLRCTTYKKSANQPCRFKIRKLWDVLGKRDQYSKPCVSTHEIKHLLMQYYHHLIVDRRSRKKMCMGARCNKIMGIFNSNLPIPYPSYHHVPFPNGSFSHHTTLLHTVSNT
jgi:hypothetical protein